MDRLMVEVDRVTKVFGDTVRALDGLSLTVPEGIIYGLLGPNGAGKTTLIRVLATLLRPDGGTARVAGIDVTADPTGVRNRIGLAGQAAAVDAYLTGRENVEMVGRLYNLTPAEARRRAGEVLERISLTDAADRPVRTYSGGMRRRLDLAASLVGRPQVLFLDEPTTGIDPRSRVEVWEMIEDLVAGGTTLLLTSQYLDEADQLADQIGVIDNGKLISEGTADELKDRLGGTVIELTVPGERRAEAMEVLARLDCEPPVFDPHRQVVTVGAPDGAETLLSAVRLLDGAGITPGDIALHKPTLDDVFLSITGHAATAAPDGTGPDGPGPDSTVADPGPSGRRPRRRNRR